MNENQTIDHDRIMKINIEEEVKSLYIDYSMSVIAACTLPGVRDDFKPVHRRISYGTLDISSTSDKPYRKCVRVVGEVLGKYHPHGDSSVYGASACLAQDWSMHYTLVDGQGNSGSVDGNSATTIRYAECRLPKMGEHVMDNLDKSTVDIANNFDNTLQEPTVMPTGIPNLLVDGRNGIVVSVTASIPTHNLCEVIEGYCAYIGNPRVGLDELMRHIQAPDLPAGAYIYGLQGVKDVYETGHGRIIVRAKTGIESNENHGKIVVTEIPYGVNKQQFIECVAALVKEGEPGGTSNVSDESGQQGMRIVTDIKQDTNANIILNKLLRMMTLQSPLLVNNIALVRGRPRLLGLREHVKYFAEHRRDVTIRGIKSELKKAQERTRILKDLIIACDNIGEVVRIIRRSKTSSEIQTNSGERFNLDNLQSKAIISIRLSRLTGLRMDQLYAEHDELRKPIAYLESVLSDPEPCKKAMKDEPNEVEEKYGNDRRTKITPDEHEFSAEDFYPNDPVVTTVSHLGYIKRTPLSDFHEQARDGVRFKGATHRDQGFTEFIYPATMHQTMLSFTKKGRCYRLKCYNIPEGAEDSKGRTIQDLLNIDSDDAINAILRLHGLNNREFINSHYAVFATKNGTVKETSLEVYSRPRASGVTAINIVEGDGVADVRLTNGEGELVMANRNGRTTHFDGNTVRTIGRTATGVRGMQLDDGDDAIVGMIVVNDPVNKTVVVVNENDYGKHSLVEDCRRTGRSGKGVRTLNITDEIGRLVAIKNVTNDNGLTIINKSGITTRLAVSECRVMDHATQGVRLISLSKKNDVTANVCKAMGSELEAPLEEDNKEELDQPDREGEDTMNSRTDKSAIEGVPLVDFDDELEPNK